jgi:copper transport protein
MNGRAATNGRAAKNGRRVEKPERRPEKPDRAEQLRELETRKRLRLSVWIEVAIGTVVLAITSLLVATPPGARPPSAQPQASPPAQRPPEVVATQLALSGGGRVYVQLDPARTGATTLLVTVLDSASKAWDVPEVTAALSLPAQGIGPLPVTLREVRPGDYVSAGLTMPMAGSWLLRLKIRSSEVDLLTAEAAVPVY